MSDLYQCTGGPGCCGRIWPENEVDKPMKGVSKGKPVELRFCPTSWCNGLVNPVPERRHGDRRAA